MSWLGYDSAENLHDGDDDGVMMTVIIKYLSVTKETKTN